MQKACERLFLNALKTLPIQAVVYSYLQVSPVKEIYFQYSLYWKQTLRKYFEIWDLPDQTGYINVTLNVAALHQSKISSISTKDQVIRARVLQLCNTYTQLAYE